jgi:hypothetical protein
MNIVEQLSGAARQRVKQAAEVISATRAPVKSLAQAGQKLNTLTHDYVEQLLVEQTRAFEGLIDRGVDRLQRLARADSARSLVREQSQLGSDGRKLLARDAGKLWKIVASTGREIGALASNTYAELIHRTPTVTAPVARRKPSKKAATKRAHSKKSR